MVNWCAANDCLLNLACANVGGQPGLLSKNSAETTSPWKTVHLPKLSLLVDTISAGWEDSAYKPKRLILCNQDCAMAPLMTLMSHAIARYNEALGYDMDSDDAFLYDARTAKMILFGYENMGPGGWRPVPGNDGRQGGRGQQVQGLPTAVVVTQTNLKGSNKYKEFVIYDTEEWTPSRCTTGTGTPTGAQLQPLIRQRQNLDGTKTQTSSCLPPCARAGRTVAHPGTAPLVAVADVQSFGTGTDFINVDNLWIVSPPRNLTTYIQNVGRIMRLCSSTKQVSVTVLACGTDDMEVEAQFGDLRQLERLACSTATRCRRNRRSASTSLEH